MLNDTWEVLGRLPQVLELLAFRAQPCLAYMLLARSTSLGGKLSAGALYVALWGCLLQLDVPAQRIYQGFVPLFWCASMSLLVYRLRDQIADRVLSRAALFVLCFFMFQLAPALLAPAELLAAALVLGWDMTLSSYSYCVDTASLKRRPSLGECIFFIVVNPTLVFVDRGKRIGAPRLDTRGLARIGFGLLTLLAHHALPAALGARQFGPSGRWLWRYLNWLRAYGGRLLGVALAHSGLASVQIGLMALIGYRIPERYNFPLLAASPQAFWRRWNVWVGRWALRYVFTPLALQQARLWRKRAPLVGKGIAALATFAAVGLLHDVFFFCRGLAAPVHAEAWKWTAGFALFGLLFAVWLLLVAIGSRLTTRGRGGIVRGGLSWFAFMHCLLLVIWLISPEASGGLVFVQ